MSSDGFRLGSLCMVDSAPRQFSAEHCAMLSNFAGMHQLGVGFDLRLTLLSTKFAACFGARCEGSARAR